MFAKRAPFALAAPRDSTGATVFTRTLWLLLLPTRWVLGVTGQDRLLAGRRVLGRAVQLRNPYVDALSLIQLRALRGLRAKPGPDGQVKDAAGLQRLLLLSVNGLAAGLQNTG